MHIGNIPFALFNFPSNDNSPINTVLSNFFCSIVSLHTRIPTAIGKSNREPSFLISAGAKLTTIFLLCICQKMTLMLIE